MTRATGPPPPESAAPDGAERSSVLAAIRRAVAEVVGSERAEEVLFRLGRGWGREELERLPDAGDGPRERFERAARSLGEQGLGRIALDAFELADGGACRVLGRVLDPRAVEGSASPRGGGLCGLTAGYLAGLASAATGVDLVCTPLSCAPECPNHGCRFELHPAHEPSRLAPDPGPSAGSARFYLDSMGAALGESEISLADLIENTDDAIVLVDRHDIVRFWNAGAERMFLYPRAEAIGRRIDFLLPEELRQGGELEALNVALARDGRVSSHQTRRLRKDGVELRVSVTRNVLHDERGQPIGSTAILRDVTELHRKDSELQQARAFALLGELAARVAHEIKNPLAGISGAIQILAREPGMDEARREVFEGIRAEVERLDATVHDLLGFARPTPLRLAPTNLAHFVRDVVESVGCRQPLAGHELAIEVPEDLVVRIDPRLMGQVLSNLVHNALQAMPEGGALRIAASDGGAAVAVEVADSGAGIAAADLEAIFEPFFTTKSRGTGLGLAISRKNVEAHGGRLEVESRPGEGARFRIVLPSAEPEPEPGRSGAGGDSGRAGISSR